MDKFCKHCGSKHTATEYPKHCTACDQTTWINPIPVAVIIQPVTDGARTGILLGKRGHSGDWAFPAGFVDMSDPTVAHAAVRELHEETGLVVGPEWLSIVHSYNTGRNMLVFCLSRLILKLPDLEAFVPCEECPEIRVAWEPEPLCFASHEEILARALAGGFSTTAV